MNDLSYYIVEHNTELKSRPCEKFLVEFCTSALLKALKFNLLSLKKADGQTLRSAEVQKSALEFSRGLDLNLQIFVERL
jgi:hypothetical protein